MGRECFGGGVVVDESEKVVLLQVRFLWKSKVKNQWMAAGRAFRVVCARTRIYRLPPTADNRQTTKAIHFSTQTNHHHKVRHSKLARLLQSLLRMASVQHKEASSSESATAALSASMESTRMTPAVPSGKSLPTSLTRSWKIDGIVTDALVQIFADRVVVQVTQLEGKVGNYLLCQATPSPVDPKAVDWSVTTVLGNREDTLLSVYARRLTQKLLELNLMTTSSGGEGSMASSSAALEVMLGISLSNDGRSPEIFSKLIDLLVDLIQDAHRIASSGQEQWEKLD